MTGSKLFQFFYQGKKKKKTTVDKKLQITRKCINIKSRTESTILISNMLWVTLVFKTDCFPKMYNIVVRKMLSWFRNEWCNATITITQEIKIADTT